MLTNDFDDRKHIGEVTFRYETDLETVSFHQRVKGGGENWREFDNEFTKTSDVTSEGEWVRGHAAGFCFHTDESINTRYNLKSNEKAECNRH